MVLLHDTQISGRREQERGHHTRLRGTTSAGVIPLTSASRRELERELGHLRGQRSQDIPARLRAAREFGDPNNNDEYLDVREEEVMLAARIARLEDILMRAVTVDPSDSDDAVAIGSRVSVVDVATGEAIEYTIDGAHAAGRPGTVSALSPVGQALLGRSRGDRVRVELPNRRSRVLELREIRVGS